MLIDPKDGFRIILMWVCRTRPQIYWFYDENQRVYPVCRGILDKRIVKAP